MEINLKLFLMKLNRKEKATATLLKHKNDFEKGEKESI